MSLIEQTKLPTTIPNLTGKYDSFKFATQFRAMDVQLPPNFLEIGTNEKGLRFDRSKWDKFHFFFFFFFFFLPGTSLLELKNC